jgi:hypothetical protein
MTARWIAEDEEWAVPVVGYLIVFAAAMAGIFLLLYCLLQPAKTANAGLAAYSPPPGTSLEPPARKMDAPDLVELEPSPLHALAQEHVTEPAVAVPPPKQEVRRPVRKRPQTDERREAREDAWGWNGGYGQYDRYRQDDRYRRYERSRQGDYRSWW